MHIVIIGKNHGNRSRWMRELKPMITDPRGFYAESVADPSIGGIRIYMREIGNEDSQASDVLHVDMSERKSDEEQFIGTCVNRHTAVCVRGYEYITPRLQAIPDGSSVIMDHLGSMDACYPPFQRAVLDLFDRCTVLAAMPDRVPDYLAHVLKREDVRIFYADQDSPEEMSSIIKYF